MFHSRKTRGLAAATLILTATPVAMADVTGAYVVRYSVTAEDFDGTEVTVNVADIYLSSDDPNDTVLNAYDLSIADAGKVPYFQSSAGTGWLPNNSGGLFDTAAVRSADSFITVGGVAQGVTFPEQTPGAGTGSGFDPNFGGNDTDYPGDLAGWFNGSPPSLNGQVGQIARPDGGFGLGVLIGRFSFAGPFNLNGSNLSVTWNQGIGTPGKQQLFVMSDPVDCNANGIPDDQDILDGTSADCDGSFVPDECEIADGTVLDCNQNGIPDQCEINEGTAEDCDQNGVPDECDTADLANDYNQNGVPDSCEGLTVPGDFESIADAIATAPAGSVVFVEPGIYEGPVVLDRGVAIVAADGPGTTKLDGSKSLGPVLIIDGAPAGAVLAGFTIRAGDPSGEHPMGGGIVGVDSFATIADCVIVGNTGMEGGGLRFEGFGFPVVVGCEIRNNLSYGPGGGVYGPEFRVEDCTIESNISLEGVGHAIASSNAWVYDSTIRNHDADGTVVDQGSWIGLGDFGMRVWNCLIEDNAGTASYGVGEVKDSIVRNNGGNGVADATVIQNCTITGNSGDGVFAAFGGIFDSTISGNGGVGFRGTIDPQYFIDNTVCGNTEGALAGMTNDELLEFGVDNIILDDRCPDFVVPDDADTIQLAIDTSIDGDRIVVRPGEYPGFELIGRDVEILSSEGKATTTIGNVYFDGSNDPAVMVIRGFTIDATEGLVPVPAVVADGSLRIEASTITGGTDSGVVARGGMPQLIDTEVTGNSSPSSGGGIRLEAASLMLEGVLVSGNSIPLAASSRGGGVYVEGGAELILIDTTICDNVRENLANFGVVSDQGGNTICLANDCDQNGIEDASDIGDLGRPDCDGNNAIDSCEIAADPGLDCDDDGILDSCELADGTAPDINQNGVIDACEPELVFDVPSTFTTIASAFAVAPDGSVIGLDPGVYTEPIDFADRNLVIRGDLDDPSAVVIDGSAAPASIVTFAGGQTSDAGLEGLTVTGGTMGTPLPGQPTSLAGGAVFVNGCSPRFDRVIFRDNVAGFGGGVYALGGDSTYVDCVFRNNFASTDGGGFMSFDSNAEVRGCIFDDNRAVNDGGATKIARGQALIADCEIFENQATEGGGIYFFSNPDTVPLRIEGTSVTNNLATKFGGGIKARFGLPGFTILDSIMCDNQPDSIVGDYEDLGGNTLCVCPCDLNGDGLVNGVDLGLYLGYQSTCIPGEYCPIDFDGDGVITGGDLGLLLGFWGLCP